MKPTTNNRRLTTKKKKLYAILDIETTGGKFNEEGITEIAIYKFDGHKVIDQFISLVNPERPIQPFVEKLTGINSAMLKSAPKFYEVAKRIVEITENSIIVAHNAVFDYRILRTEFRRLGYKFEKNSLCTVELSKELLPEQESHSLGKLVRSLGIPIADRHRASGDALATVELFKLLLNKDLDKEIITRTIKDLNVQYNDKLQGLLTDLPSSTGIYYMYNKEGEIIYIGKSKNIKKRINQHFVATNKKAKAIQNEIDRISFEITGSEMIALLLENEEIKRHKPKYNVALKRSIYTHALYPITDDHGYIHLKLLKADGRKKHIITFSNRDSGKAFLHKISEIHGLCEKFTGIYTDKGSCFKFQIQECAGACIGKETKDDYNLRVRKIIEQYTFRNKDMLIISKGRETGEKSVTLIENSEFKGFGYFKLNHQISSLEIIRSLITPMHHNKDAQHIIQTQLRKDRRLKIMPLPGDIHTEV